MLLLTATRETQGQKPGDFFNAIEGELVVIFTDCHVPAHEDHMRCREGCPARFFGLNSHQTATTAKVSTTQISPADYALAIAAYGEHRGARAPEAMARRLAEIMLGQAAGKLPGTVAGLVDGRLQARTAPRASVRGIAIAAAHTVRLPAWHHRYGKRLRELDRDERKREAAARGA